MVIVRSVSSFLLVPFDHGLCSNPAPPLSCRVVEATELLIAAPAQRFTYRKSPTFGDLGFKYGGMCLSASARGHSCKHPGDLRVVQLKPRARPSRNHEHAEGSGSHSYEEAEASELLRLPPQPQVSEDGQDSWQRERRTVRFVP